MTSAHEFVAGAPQYDDMMLVGASVRIYVWLLFEPSDERACPLKRQVKVIDTEEQQEPVAGGPVIGTRQ